MVARGPVDAVNAEPVFASKTVSVWRLHGRAREGVDGRHRLVVVYAGRTVSDGQLVGLLREVAAAIEKTLPRGQ